MIKKSDRAQIKNISKVFKTYKSWNIKLRISVRDIEQKVENQGEKVKWLENNSRMCEILIRVPQKVKRQEHFSYLDIIFYIIRYRVFWVLSKRNERSTHIETDCYVVSEHWNKEKPSRSKPPPLPPPKSYTKEKVMMPNFSIANWTLKIVEQYLQNSKEKITFDL